MWASCPVPLSGPETRRPQCISSRGSRCCCTRRKTQGKEVEGAEFSHQSICRIQKFSSSLFGRAELPRPLVTSPNQSVSGWDVRNVCTDHIRVCEVTEVAFCGSSRRTSQPSYKIKHLPPRAASSSSCRDMTASFGASGGCVDKRTAPPA